MAKWRRAHGGALRARSGALILVLLSLLASCAIWIVAAPPRSSSTSCAPCAAEIAGNFLWYAPHSGFSNQVGELRNALRVAAILGRTLVLPPVTDHHALSLGSCPKFRIVEPRHLRAAALSHIVDLVAQSRYYSIADIVNVSAVSPSFVKTIDLRVFALLWCGADITPACSGALCHALASRAIHGNGFDRCIKMLDHGRCSSDCVYGVDDSCATTVWTYSRASSASRRRGLLWKQQPVKLKMKKYDVARRIERDIFRSLGNGSDAGRSKLLAFGSLFSAEYQGAQTHIHLHAASGDDSFDQMFHASEYLPLSLPITYAGRDYIRSRMNKEEFFCAQLRLLDGQFKNHWSKTFGSLRSRLESLQPKGGGGVGRSIALFVMTDLPREKWTATYLQELSEDSKYRIYDLDERDELVLGTASEVLSSDLGLKSGVLPYDISATHDLRGDQAVPPQILPEFLLYIQEAICSCATLGFHGTAGSTISETITQMRKGRPLCS